MWATFAPDGIAGWSLMRIPWLIKKPHFPASSIALRARSLRLLNSAQEVALIAILTESLTSKDQCSGNVNERRIPFGSLSKLESGNESADNLDLTASIDSPDKSSKPPSIALSSSCVNDGLEELDVETPAYASHLPLHSSTISA